MGGNLSLDTELPFGRQHNTSSLSSLPNSYSRTPSTLISNCDHFISDLTVYLNQYSMEILQPLGTLSLTTTTLSLLNHYSNLSLSGRQRHRHRNQETVIDLEYIRHIMGVIHSLRIENPPQSAPTSTSLIVDIGKFPHIIQLELRNVSIVMVKNLHNFRETLVRLTLFNCISNIRSVLSLCGGDESFPSPWSALGHLDLRNNKLTSLDDSLQLLPVLKVIDLSRNCLSSCHGIEHLSSTVQCINLSYNYLTSLPKLNMTTSRNVKVLLIAYNSLENTKGLSELQCLQILDLRFNCILSTSHLMDLENLHQLKHLKVIGNPFTLLKNYRESTLERVSPCIPIKFCLDEKILTKKETFLVHKKTVLIIPPTSNLPSTLNPNQLPMNDDDLIADTAPSDTSASDNENDPEFNVTTDNTPLLSSQNTLIPLLASTAANQSNLLNQLQQEEEQQQQQQQQQPPPPPTSIAIPSSSSSNKLLQHIKATPSLKQNETSTTSAAASYSQANFVNLDDDEDDKGVIGGSWITTCTSTSPHVGNELETGADKLKEKVRQMREEKDAKGNPSWLVSFNKEKMNLINATNENADEEEENRKLKEKEEEQNKIESADNVQTDYGSDWHVVQDILSLNRLMCMRCNWIFSHSTSPNPHSPLPTDESINICCPSCGSNLVKPWIPKPQANNNPLLTASSSSSVNNKTAASSSLTTTLLTPPKAIFCTGNSVNVTPEMGNSPVNEQTELFLTSNQTPAQSSQSFYPPPTIQIQQHLQDSKVDVEEKKDEEEEEEWKEMEDFNAEKESNTSVSLSYLTATNGEPSTEMSETTPPSQSAVGNSTESENENIPVDKEKQADSLSDMVTMPSKSEYVLTCMQNHVPLIDLWSFQFIDPNLQAVVCSEILQSGESCQYVIQCCGHMSNKLMNLLIVMSLESIYFIEWKEEKELARDKVRLIEKTSLNKIKTISSGPFYQWIVISFQNSKQKPIQLLVGEEYLVKKWICRISEIPALADDILDQEGRFLSNKIVSTFVKPLIVNTTSSQSDESTASLLNAMQLVRLEDSSYFNTILLVISSHLIFITIEFPTGKQSSSKQAANALPSLSYNNMKLQQSRLVEIAHLRALAVGKTKLTLNLFEDANQDNFQIEFPSPFTNRYITGKIRLFWKNIFKISLDVEQLNENHEENFST